MSVRFLVSGAVALRHWRGALSALARVGAEASLEAFPSVLVLRALNASRSAYLRVELQCSFFDAFDVRASPCIRAGVYVKHLLAASRGPKISRLAFELEAGGAHLRVNVDCESGLQKSYAIPTLETEVLQATVDAGADAAEMGRLLSGFQAALEEITVVAEPPGPGKCCRFQSFFDPTRAAGDRHQTLYTQVSLDTTNHLQGYSHAGSGTLDSTFNLKDFKIMVALCSGMEAQVALHLAGPGAPAVAFPHLPAEQGRPLGYSAELVLATLEEAAAPEEAPSPPPRHPQQHPSAAGAAAARPRPRPAVAPAAGAA